jgi:hypothetical protein
MIDAFSTLQNKKRTFILLGTAVLLGIAAAVIGIDDNPPGILFAFLGITAFVLAFAHPWRTSRQFLRLLLASILGLFVFGGLMILCDMIGSNLFGGSGVIRLLLNIGSTLFLVLALICPSGLVVGAVGAVLMAIRNRRLEGRS